MAGRNVVKPPVYASSRVWAVAQTLSMGQMMLRESLFTGTAPQRKNTCMFIPVVILQTLEPLRGTRLWDYHRETHAFPFLMEFRISQRRQAINIHYGVG